MTLLHGSALYCLVQNIIVSAQHGGPLLQKGQIKAKQVVVLDHIRVALADQRTEIADQACLIFRCRGIKRGGKATTIANGNHENAPAMWVKRGRLQVKS